MAWEKRQRGGLYYYRSFRRSDGSIGREYIGTGPEAERIAEQDRQVRERREQQRKEVKKLESKLAEVEQKVGSIIELSDMMLAACLLSAGFHCHRSEWRRKNDCV